MAARNFEFKVRVNETESAEKKLLTLNPLFIGVDHQTDTYFNVKRGRLKLREGNVENALIHYERADTAGAKQSDIILYNCNPNPALKEILSLHFGIKTVVNKIRRIYFIDNVKFHFDEVKNLGYFIEVEAIDREGGLSVGKLREQCQKYFEFFGFEENQLMHSSYSDMQ